jgi:hypothetical protein
MSALPAGAVAFRQTLLENSLRSRTKLVDEITQIRQNFSVDIRMNGCILRSPPFTGWDPPPVLIYLIETQPEIQTNMA